MPYLTFETCCSKYYVLESDMIKGASILHKHFARFGLLMHHGTETKPSKTEAMFFPRALHCFKNNNIDNENDSDSENQSMIEDDEQDFRLYNGGIISYTRKFKYLGVTITPDLRDDTEIDKRIKQGSVAVQQLLNVWRNKQVPLWAKKYLYLALPLNIVLWGCESWALTAESRRKLSSFHHKSIRKILGISMFEVKEQSITNEQVRKMFHNVKNIDEIVRQRALDCLGTQARLPDTRLPKKMITSWVRNARESKHPQINIRSTLSDHLEKIIPDLDQNAPVKIWYPLAEKEAEWRALISGSSSKKSPTKEPHPWL